MLPLQGARVRSLVRELRPHKLRDAAKKKKVVFILTTEFFWHPRKFYVQDECLACLS